MLSNAWGPEQQENKEEGSIIFLSDFWLTVHILFFVIINLSFQIFPEVSSISSHMLMISECDISHSLQICEPMLYSKHVLNKYVFFFLYLITLVIIY